MQRPVGQRSIMMRVGLTLLGGTLSWQHVLAGDLVEYGAYLSGECVTCHRIGGADAGIPSLAGLPREHILAALAAFKSGDRPSPVMRDIVGRLSDDEMSALAAYFSSLDGVRE